MQTIRVDAGAVEYTAPQTIDETTGKNISGDTVQMCLARLNTSPTVWVTAVEDTPPNNSTRVVKMLVDGSVPGGVYTLWWRITDTPEVVPRRAGLVNVVSTVIAGADGSTFHVVDNGDGTESLVYG